MTGRSDAREDVPFIVMSAPNGARRGKADHSAIPLSPHELAENAQAILDSGASILHLHVRGEAEQHTLDPQRYRAAISAVREQVGNRLVIQIPTEACGIYSAEQQMAVVKELKPEAVSIAAAGDMVCTIELVRGIVDTAKRVVFGLSPGSVTVAF